MKGEPSKMAKDMTRKIFQSILSLIMTAMAAWLATYITNKLFGEPEEEEA
jgi:hypothetical protein